MCIGWIQNQNRNIYSYASSNFHKTIAAIHNTLRTTQGLNQLSRLTISIIDIGSFIFGETFFSQAKELRYQFKCVKNLTSALKILNNVQDWFCPEDETKLTTSRPFWLNPGVSRLKIIRKCFSTIHHTCSTLNFLDHYQLIDLGHFAKNCAKTPLFGYFFLIPLNLVKEVSKFISSALGIWESYKNISKVEHANLVQETKIRTWTRQSEKLEQFFSSNELLSEAGELEPLKRHYLEKTRSVISRGFEDVENFSINPDNNSISFLEKKVNKSLQEIYRGVLQIRDVRKGNENIYQRFYLLNANNEDVIFSPDLKQEEFLKINESYHSNLEQEWVQQKELYKYIKLIKVESEKNKDLLKTVKKLLKLQRWEIITLAISKGNTQIVSNLREIYRQKVKSWHSQKIDAWLSCAYHIGQIALAIFSLATFFTGTAGIVKLGIYALLALGTYAIGYYKFIRKKDKDHDVSFANFQGFLKQNNSIQLSPAAKAMLTTLDAFPSSRKMI